MNQIKFLFSTVNNFIRPFFYQLIVNFFILSKFNKKTTHRQFNSRKFNNIINKLGQRHFIIKISVVKSIATRKYCLQSQYCL